MTVSSRKPGGGPKTRRGKQISRRNALKHGLSATRLAPDHRERVDRLVAELTKGVNDPDVHRLARQFAEAQLRLDEVDAYECQLFAETASLYAGPGADDDGTATRLQELVLGLVRLTRYLDKAQSRWHQATRRYEDATRHLAKKPAD